MDAKLAHEFSIQLDESLAFSRLSGDYNPLHVDPIYARRTPFGSTVVHGIHLLLASLDRAIDAENLRALVPTDCSVTFSNPAVTGSHVALDIRFERETHRLRLNGTVRQRPAFSASVFFAAAPASSHARVVNESVATPIAPNQGSFPPSLNEGRAPLRLEAALLRALFPTLATCTDTAWIADLLASTQIVGMQCPGMNSIYSGCKLKLSAEHSGPVDSMRYQVTKLDERFKLIRMNVHGAHFNGTLETFFRPPPVAQASLADICRLVPANAYAGHHALVVGGSRGLGELAAKCVLAGGGAVTLTYARGRDDAAAICREAAALQRACDAEQLDLSALLEGAAPDWLKPGRFTHVYYFASPHIGKTADAAWDQNLFSHFCSAYVEGFAKLVQALASPAHTPRFLYPSSIFVAQTEKGFAEYAAAKAAGEACCDYLAQSLRTTILHPRLPRMRTDQTNALLDSGSADPLPIIRDVVQQLHAPSSP